MHIYSIQGSCVWSCIAMTPTLWKPQWVEDTNFLYMDITISKRGITLPNLTKQMSCTFILQRCQVYQLSCGCLYKWDRRMRLKTYIRSIHKFAYHTPLLHYDVRRSRGWIWRVSSLSLPKHCIWGLHGPYRLVSWLKRGLFHTFAVGRFLLSVKHYVSTRSQCASVMFLVKL
mgnify:CR=1 FL=1